MIGQNHKFQNLIIYTYIHIKSDVRTLILGFRRDVDEICTLLGYYEASCLNCLPMFPDNVSVPSSRVKSPSWKGSQPVTQILTGKVPMGWGSVSVIRANRVGPVHPLFPYPWSNPVGCYHAD
jgi:hypothetical protein